MKFECGTEQLTRAVTLASRFVDRRPNLPALGSILVTAENSRLILRATNLECGIEITLSAKVKESGVAAIPGSVLAGFLSNTHSKLVLGALRGTMFNIETEKASASIKTIPHEDFPLLPKVSATNSFTVKSSDLLKAIRSVVYCASVSAVKPELQSVLLYGESGKFVAVATDSFRLAEKTVPLRSGNSPQLLLPAKNAVEFMRILESGSGDVEIYYNENQLSTHVGDVYYTSRLIDGAFPNYRQILPKSFTTEIIALREDLSQALKALTVFSDKFAQVSFVVDPEKKSILLSSKNPDVGEQTSTIRATISGDGVSINFNSRYLGDSLQAIVGESVRIHSNGPGKPLLIKDAADNSFLYLAMPMNR